MPRGRGRGRKSAKQIEEVVNEEVPEEQEVEEEAAVRDQTVTEEPDQAGGGQADQLAHPGAKERRDRVTRNPGLKLTEAEEGRVFEYVEAHSMLYNKNNPAFSHKNEKAALWGTLAEELQVKEHDGNYKMYLFFP